MRRKQENDKFVTSTSTIRALLESDTYPSNNCPYIRWFLDSTRTIGERELTLDIVHLNFVTESEGDHRRGILLQPRTSYN